MTEEELKENLKSQRWRLNNLYTIVNKRGEKETFKFSPEQDTLYSQMHFQNIILKARQLGMTTFIQIFMLDACLFNSDTYAGVIAHNREDAEDFFTKKIKFAYEHLPPSIKAMRPCVNDSAKSLSFNNGSAIRVGTSLRSGTYHYLHVSEFGKICARYPEKAREIVTGAFNTLDVGQFLFVESTAEGREGYFFKFCQTAQNMQLEGKELSDLDMKFHFFPWWENAGYVLDITSTVLTKEDVDYFDSLADKYSIHLTPEQKSWYVKKKNTQGEDMKREYPSTPEEAFEKAVEGAYYSKQMAKARSTGRIGKVPHEPRLLTNVTFDLGHNDATAMWLHQKHRKENRLVGYHEASGEDLSYYANWLHRWARDNEATFGEFYMPHDIEVTELGSGDTRKKTAEDLGIKPIVVIPKTPSINDDIEEVRNFLATCYFDEAACVEGIKTLDNYRKTWNDSTGAFSRKPLHDWASNGADSFRYLAMACKMNDDNVSEAAPIDYGRMGTIA